MVAKTARFLAPIALVAVALGVYLVVHGNLAHGHPGQTVATNSASLVEGHRRAARHPKRVPKYYTVRGGDTLSAIAARTGVSQLELVQLNPKLANSQNSLQIGQRLRLRR